MLKRKLILVTMLFLIFSVAGCTAFKPNIIAVDNIPGVAAREAVMRSIKVVWPEEAVLYQDVTTVAPIQIVVPRRNMSGISELFKRPTYKVRLFSKTQSNLLSIISVVNGSADFCANPNFEIIGNDTYSKSSGYPIRCGKTVFSPISSGSKGNGILSSLIKGEVSIGADVKDQSRIYDVLIEYRQQVELGI